MEAVMTPMSFHRLRATLVFATISAIAWAIVGTIVATGYELLHDQQVAAAGFLRAALIFAMFGFAAGTAWAVTLALLPRKADQTVTPLAATLAGALGGSLVMLGAFIAMDDLFRWDFRALLVPISITAGIGAAVGFLIQRAASSGQLPAPERSPGAIEPGPRS